MLWVTSKKELKKATNLYYKYYNRCNKAIKEIESISKNSKIVSKKKINTILKKLKGEL